MKKVKEIIRNFDFTMEEFWDAVALIPDEVAGRKHKKNIQAYFKKDGTPKTKALNLSTDDDVQTFQHTANFLHKDIRHEIFKLRRRKEIEKRKEQHRDMKDKKVKSKSIYRDKNV